MDFAFTEEQQELRASARAFLADHSSSEQIRSAMESKLGYDEQVWKQIGAELGWAAVHIPEEYDGLGLSYVELVALLETMGEQLLCSPFFSSVCLGANALLCCGSEEQKRQLLPDIAAGQTRATLAVTESKGDWDLGSIAATAKREGEDFVLSGQKRFVMDGHSADLLMIAARAPGSSGHDGISLFAVPGDRQGLARRRRRLAEGPSARVGRARSRTGGRRAALPRHVRGIREGTRTIRATDRIISGHQAQMCGHDGCGRNGAICCLLRRMRGG